jgi:VWFA-related protein
MRLVIDFLKVLQVTFSRAMRLTAASLAPLLGFGLAGGLDAQSKQTFYDAVEVEVVEVDVVVVDRKGVPVRGLEKDDFKLYVDGEAVEISNFLSWSVVAGGSQSVHSDSSPGGGAESSEATRTKRGVGGVPLLIAIYLDELSLHPARRGRVLDRLQAAVEPWYGLGAQFVLAVFDGRLDIAIGPTRDLSAVLRAASLRVAAAPARAYEFARGRRRTFTELALNAKASSETAGEVVGDGGIARCEREKWFQLLSIARNHAYETEARSAVAMEGLADLISSLSGVTGKKAVVYVSDGLPQRPGVDVFTYLVEQLCPDDTNLHSEAYAEILQFDDASDVNRIAAHANANRVTFYPLDAGGLDAGLHLDPSFRSLAEAPSTRNDEIARMNRQNGLNMLASETGGTALLNSNDIRPLLAEVSEQLEASYSLGFLPTIKGRGNVRQIRVELAPSAAKRRKVQYRRSYRDKPLEERLAERLFSAAHLKSSSNPLLVDVGLSFRERSGKRDHEIVVEVAVPASGLPLLASRDELQGELRLWLLAVDTAKGARTRIRQKTLTVGGEDGVAPRNGSFRFEVGMNLPAGAWRVAVGVRDELTGVTSLVSESLSVPMESKP